MALALAWAEQETGQPSQLASFNSWWQMLSQKQPLNANLTALAEDSTPFGRSLLELADQPEFRALMGLPFVLAQSAVAVSHTGTTSEATLATIPVPAGLMGANGQMVIESLWSVTNNGNNKTPRIRLAGANLHGPSFTSVGSVHDRVRIANRNNTATQVLNANSSAVYGQATSSVFTAAVNTAASFDITLSAQLANAADAMTLESYLITVFPKA